MPRLPGKDDTAYWKLIEQWAHEYQSDGCTGVPDFYVEACWEHDYHHRYAVTLFGDPITFHETNTRFRQARQSRSKLRLFSIVSWERYLAVASPIGKKLWDEHRQKNLPRPRLS